MSNNAETASQLEFNRETINSVNILGVSFRTTKLESTYCITGSEKILKIFFVSIDYLLHYQKFKL